MVLPTTVSLLIMLTLQVNCLTAAASSSPMPTTSQPINSPSSDPSTNSASGFIIVVMPNSQTPVPSSTSGSSTPAPGAPTDSSAVAPTSSDAPGTAASATDSTLQPPASDTQAAPFLNDTAVAPESTRPPRPVTPINQFQSLWQNPFLLTSFAGNDNFKERLPLLMTGFMQQQRRRQQQQQQQQQPQQQRQQQQPQQQQQEQQQQQQQLEPSQGVNPLDQFGPLLSMMSDNFRSLWGASLLSKSLGGGVLGNTFAYSTFDLPEYYLLGSLLRSRLTGIGAPSTQSLRPFGSKPVNPLLLGLFDI